mgnify:CR=1 FL=1
MASNRLRLIVKTALATTLSLGAAAALGGWIVLESGWYNVAATQQHFQVVHSVLENAMKVIFIHRVASRRRRVLRHPRRPPISGMQDEAAEAVDVLVIAHGPDMAGPKARSVSQAAEDTQEARQDYVEADSMDEAIDEREDLELAAAEDVAFYRRSLRSRNDYYYEKSARLLGSDLDIFGTTLGTTGFRQARRPRSSTWPRCPKRTMRSARPTASASSGSIPKYRRHSAHCVCSVTCRETRTRS